MSSKNTLRTRALDHFVDLGNIKGSSFQIGNSLFVFRIRPFDGINQFSIPRIPVGADLSTKTDKPKQALGSPSEKISRDLL